MRRLPAAGLLLLAALWVAIGGFPPGSTSIADAHAVLVRSDPPVNAQVREPPAAISMYFSEPLERNISTARVIDASQQRVDTGIVFDDSDGTHMTVTVGQMAPGYYSVIWETLSTVDGHRIAGSFPITVLNTDGTPPPGTPPSLTSTVAGTAAKPERVVTKWVLLLGSTLLLGALASTWVAAGLTDSSGNRARAAAERLAVSTAVLSIAALAIVAFIELALQADTIGGLGKVSEVLGDTRWGERWLWRNALLVPLSVLVFMLARVRAGLWQQKLLVLPSVLMVLGYLAIVATVSHAAAGAGSFWATSSDFIHLAAAALWGGLLFQIVLGFRWLTNEVPRNERPPLLAAALRRFSLIAAFSVAALLFTGTFNGIIELERPRDFLNTGYGQSLLLKLLLLVPLLAVAGANAYLFRPEVEEEAATLSTRRGATTSGWSELEGMLSRTLKIEAALIAAVLLVAGLLSQLPPTRGISGPANVPAKFTETREDSGVSVTLNIDPNQPGLNTFETYLTGAVSTVERVRLRFSPADGSSPESEVFLDPSNPPVFYVGRGPFLGSGGEWNVRVDLLRNTGADLSLPFAVNVIGVDGAGAAARGGEFAWPRPLTTTTAGILIASGAFSLAIVVLSWPRPGRPSGYLGDAADWLASFETRPSLSLIVLVVVGVGLGVLLGSHAHNVLTGDEAREGNPIASSPESIERGRALFLQNCSQCHGETGRGDGPLASSLPLPPANLYDHIPYHPDQFFFGVMTNGLSGIMPSFASTLSESDRWDVLNYMRDQFGQPPAAQ